MSEQGGWPPNQGQQPWQQPAPPSGHSQPGYPDYATYAAYAAAGWTGPPPPTGPPERPAAMDKALRLMWIAVAVNIASALAGFLLSNQEATTNPFGNTDDLTASEQRTVEAIGLVAGIIGLTIVVGLWWWMIHKNGQGKQWARTTATVFAVVSAAFWVIGVASQFVLDINVDPAWLRWALLLVGAAAQALHGWIMWLLYRPESEAFYDAVSNPRPFYSHGYPSAYPQGQAYGYGQQQPPPYAYGSGQQYPQSHGQPPLQQPSDGPPPPEQP